MLKPSSVRLLVVLATDSTNATRALTLSNIAAFSQLNQVRASFVVVVGRCGKWASVAAGAAALGVPFDCVLRPPESSSSPSKNGGGAAFRPKLPLQLHGAMKYLHRMVEETSEEQQQAAEAIAERDALDPGAAGSSSTSSSRSKRSNFATSGRACSQSGCCGRCGFAQRPRMMLQRSRRLRTRCRRGAWRLLRPWPR